MLLLEYFKNHYVLMKKKLFHNFCNSNRLINGQFNYLIDLVDFFAMYVIVTIFYDSPLARYPRDVYKQSVAQTMELEAFNLKFFTEVEKQQNLKTLFTAILVLGISGNLSHSKRGTI